jgi:tetratricopeptide (TPR) repeat protein
MAAADPVRAAELRAKATALLEPLETAANSDPAIAIALGMGYLAAGDPVKAEAALRRALAAKPDDIDANFQLAEALAQQGRRDEALASMLVAYNLDKTRLDIGLQLARRYDEAGRAADASTLYDELLAAKDLTLDVRASAGRFFERQGKIDKARQQGDEILKLDDKHPAGLFLKGIGLFADGKLEPARRSLQEATDVDPNAQYLDAFGRISEALFRANDPRGKDDALRAYAVATQADPTMVNPLAGMGRLYLDPKAPQADRALTALLAANKLAPKDPDIQYNLGLAYDLLHNPGQTIAWMTKSLATKPRSEGFYKVGDIYFDDGQSKSAAAWLVRATELGAAEERKDGTTLEWMTDAYYKLGASLNDLRKPREARAAWQTWLDRDPKDPVKVDKTKRLMLGFPQ